MIVGRRTTPIEDQPVGAYIAAINTPMGPVFVTCDRVDVGVGATTFTRNDDIVAIASAGVWFAMLPYGSVVELSPGELREQEYEAQQEVTMVDRRMGHGPNTETA